MMPARQNIITFEAMRLILLLLLGFFLGVSSITSLGNVAVNAKAVKVVENGQIVIVRDGVRFNIVGSAVK